jgi:hypothetical protein
MAKTPSAKVSKTSGQGVSRLSYQKGRALSGKTGGGASTGIDASFGKSPLGGSGSGRSYAKGEKSPGDSGFNVSYGDTLMPTDLADIKALGEGPPPKPSKAMNPAKPKAWSKK